MLADQCVMCGHCLPHCPTYAVGRTESESPRGRIAFAKAAATGRLALTPTLLQHLDQCLTCGACERVCPAEVHYGDLLIATRALLRSQRPESAPQRRLLRLVRHPRRLRLALRIGRLPGVARIARTRMLRRLLRPLGLERFANEWPAIPQLRPWPELVPARGAARGRVGLFLGCVASVLDRDVHEGAIRVLTALGYDVVLPRGQACCGALARHAGDLQASTALATSTRAAFLASGVETVLVSASGCFGTLRDAVLSGSTVRVREIHDFIAGDAALASLCWHPLARRVALHTPCTQRNVARAQDSIVQLLGLIPQISILPLPLDPGCCGAAGGYYLEHPDIADRLRADTIEYVQRLAPDLLLTSNVGCRLFLGNGLRHNRSAIQASHPIALLAQQLDN